MQSCQYCDFTTNCSECFRIHMILGRGVFNDSNDERIKQMHLTWTDDLSIDQNHTCGKLPVDRFSPPNLYKHIYDN